MQSWKFENKYEKVDRIYWGVREREQYANQILTWLQYTSLYSKKTNFGCSHNIT